MSVKEAMKDLFYIEDENGASAIAEAMDEQGYKRVLARVEHLWGADPSSHDGVELDRLLASLDIYETAHYCLTCPNHETCRATGPECEQK